VKAEAEAAKKIQGFAIGPAQAKALGPRALGP